MSEETSPVTPELTPTVGGVVLSAGTTEGLFSGASDAPVTEAAPEFVPIFRGKIDKHGVAMGTGRRKTAVARVRIKNGSGKIVINGRPLEQYFPVEKNRAAVLLPLIVSDAVGKYDITVRATGGGITGQSGAIVLGIARCLQILTPSLHKTLSDHGFLTRDSRMVERKKYGHKKARRSFQFSKR